MFQRPHGKGAVSPVISQYAATLIAVRCSPEMVFFASIRNGGLALVDAAGNAVDTWVQSLIVVTDGIPALSSSHPIWIKPEKWNQGGYDAIMVCKRTQHVRMVQVTSAHKHSFRINHFYEWLKKLSELPQFEVKKLEIYFVVEQEKLSTFDIETVFGQGLPQGKETELVQIVGIRGL
ncbi:TPA: hypothetical protein N0F65_008995 [Lagenidium giganteum]|uniref:LAGLIDADG endonuclease n=1 Tax=Lagenidium giganteum TaxID=4803 RepID=A0AAV2YP97_9STRA|nr:TPA: hypothetical protein N0F65_008995 [Lagenidium giganteum]